MHQSIVLGPAKTPSYDPRLIASSWIISVLIERSKNYRMDIFFKNKLKQNISLVFLVKDHSLSRLASIQPKVDFKSSTKWSVLRVGGRKKRKLRERGKMFHSTTLTDEITLRPFVTGQKRRKGRPRRRKKPHEWMLPMLSTRSKSLAVSRLGPRKTSKKAEQKSLPKMGPNIRSQGMASMDRSPPRRIFYWNFSCPLN